MEKSVPKLPQGVPNYPRGRGGGGVPNYPRGRGGRGGSQITPGVQKLP